MKLRTLHILNYKGIVNRILELDKINVLVGGNGKGKSSIIDAFRSLADGGSEPDSVHTDAEEAMLRFTLDVEEGDPGGYDPGRYIITRTIRRDGYTLNVKNPKGKGIPKEATFVKTFFPTLGLDPVAFDLLTDEKRAEVLQSLLKVPVTTAEVRTAAGLVDLGVIEKDAFEDGIGAIDKFDDELAKQASDLRAVVTNLTGSINTHEKLLEGRSAEDVTAAMEKAQADLTDSTDELQQKAMVLTAARDEAIKTAAAAAKADTDAVTKWYEEEKAKLDTERLQRLETIAAAEKAVCLGAHESYDVKAESELGPINARVADAKARIKHLQGQLEDAAKLAGEQAQLEKWREEKVAKAEKIENITIARKQLSGLRDRKLALAKLDGMSIRRGRLYIGDVLSSEVNTAHRLMKWVEVCSQFAIAGQVIVVDDMEHLTAANRAIFEQAFRDSPNVLLAGIVDPDDGPLRVQHSLADAVPAGTV